MRKTVLFNFHGLVNGSLLDCLDLFVYCKSSSIDMDFCYIELSGENTFLSHVRNLFLERGYQKYCDIFILDEIRRINKLDILRYDKIVIFDYTTLLENLDFFKKSEVVFISNLLSTEIDNKFILNRKKYSNVKVWGEEKYSFYREYEYVQKMLLPRVNHYQENMLIVCPGVETDELHSLLKRRHIEYNPSYLTRTKSSYNRLWGNFNKLIYIQSPRVYDRKPRLLYECTSLNIPVTYHRYDDKIDGSYYRYRDTKQREYTESDDLIGWIRDE